MAAVQDLPMVVGHLASGGDREGVDDGDEEGTRQLVGEEAEHGRCPPMELAKAAEEAGVMDEAAPVLANVRSTEKVDGLRWKAHENLHEEVVRENP